MGKRTDATNPENTLERIRVTLKNIGLPAWANWVDRALELEAKRREVLERRASMRVVRPRGGETP